MEKRTVLAIILSFLIISAWYYIQPKLIGEPPKTPPKTTAAAPQQPPASPAADQAAPAAPPAVSAPAETVQAGAKAVRDITVETALYTARWNTRGGVLTSLKLKKYLTTKDKNAKPVELIKTPMPALLISNGNTDSNLIYDCPQQGTASVEGSPLLLTFTAEASPGVLVKRTYTIDPKTYVIGFQASIMNNTQAPIALSGGLVFNNIYRVGEKSSSYAFEGPALLYDNHLEEFKVDKVKEIGTYRDFSGDVRWFGFEDKYFLQTVIEKSPTNATVTIRRTDAQHVAAVYTTGRTTVQPGTAFTRDRLIFIGPKEIKTLKSVGYELNKALDFGFFDVIAKPLLIAMNWINTYTGSYGWTIIILTIIIKIVLYPLTLKSFKSMKELQKVQPLMKEIQQKYKDDKQKLNQELMKLYSEHKINPMGGCLPMLLQIPILFALYKVFYQAIELRHTPFHIVGTWLPDLSAMDPYYITPVLMGASQFVMQKMTPTAGDPMQQKILLIMPVIFTFMFLSFPSGLVIYWLVSNVLSIAQQAYINRKLS
jgi:YidC/Oxa1 family membrane protein insertase